MPVAAIGYAVSAVLPEQLAACRVERDELSAGMVDGGRLPVDVERGARTIDKVDQPAAEADPKRSAVEVSLDEGKRADRVAVNAEGEQWPSFVGSPE